MAFDVTRRRPVLYGKWSEKDKDYIFATLDVLIREFKNKKSMALNKKLRIEMRHLLLSTGKYYFI